MALRPNLLAAISGGSAPPYRAGAVHFTRNSSGLFIPSVTCVDSSNISIVLWMRFSFEDAFSGQIFTVAPTTKYSPQLYIGGGGNFGGALHDANPYLNFDADPDPLDEIWNCILISASTNFVTGQKKFKLYVGDVDATGTWFDNDIPAFLNKLNGLKFTLGNDSFGSGAGIDMADFRLYMGTSLLTDGDIVEPTRRLFIDQNGKPVAPAVATAALGTPGTISFSGDASSFGDNQGTGGAASSTGDPLTNAASSPSD